MNRIKSNLNEIDLALSGAGKRADEHVWTPGADVQSVWKKFGWTPPSQVRADRFKRSATPAQRTLRIVRG
jgi:hypothetical protein